MPKGWLSAQWTCCWRQGGYFRMHLEVFFREGMCVCSVLWLRSELCVHTSAARQWHLFSIRVGMPGMPVLPLLTCRLGFFFSVLTSLAQKCISALSCPGFLQHSLKLMVSMKNQNKCSKPSSRQQHCQGGLELKNLEGKRVFLELRWKYTST